MTTRPSAYTAGYKVVAVSRLRKPMAAELQPPRQSRRGSR